ncbi:MAG TPA: hypothetical protein VHD81_10170 [Mycobacteriales bacterium]|nr:hypothetical protein [Mycobacteriales bacterium]
MTFEEPMHHQASRSEMALLATGVLSFIASFFPWYSATFAGDVAELGVTGTYNAWHGLMAVGILLVLFSLVVTASGPLLGEEPPPRGLAISAALLACAGAVLVLVKSFDLPSLDIPGVTAHLRWGGWLLIALVLVHAVLCLVRAVQAPRS